MTQQLVLEGPLPLWLGILLALALFGLSVWLGRRDFSHTGRSKWIPIFVLFRLVALGALLWMLLGPTQVRSLSGRVTKSIAILVDHSASMKLVDPVDESGNNLRWLASIDQQERALVDIDHELGRLGVSFAQLNQLSRSGSSTVDASETESQIEQILATLSSSSERLQETANALPAELTQQASSLGDMADQLDQLVNESASAETIATDPDKLGELASRSESILRNLTNLSDRIAAALEKAPDSSARSDLEQGSSRSRRDKVRTFLQEANKDWLMALKDQATVNQYSFGDQILPISQPSETAADDQASSSSTDLAAALQQIALDAADKPLEAAIILTDGGHNQGDDPTSIAGHLPDIPLILVPIGNTKMPRDVILHHTLAPRAVYQNDLVVVESMITAYRCEGEKVRVELLADGAVVDEQTLSIQREIFDSRVQLKWKANDLGRHQFQVRTLPLTEEKSIENNQNDLAVHVMEDKIRVLIADNMPRWEFRYLINLFDRDERIEYEQLIFEPRHDSRGRTVRPPAFPYDYDQWMKYRIVILGDVMPNQLTLEHQQLLRRYVTEYGGNLILIAGREGMPDAFANQPLERLLPVEASDRPISTREGFHLNVTPEGAHTMPIQLESTSVSSEALWRDMSRRLPIYSLSDYSQLKPTGHSLLAATRPSEGAVSRGGSPLSFLSWHYVGRGRVVYLAAPISYQLRYLKGDRYHHRFWGQMLRWAIARDLAEGSRTVRLATDKTRYEAGEAIRVTSSLYRLDGRVFSGAAPVVSVSQGDQTLSQIQLAENPARPGTYEGNLSGVPEGKVKLSLGGDPIPALLAAERYDGDITTTIHVDPNGALEFRHPLCNLPLLNQVARSGNGVVLPPTAVASAIGELDMEPELLESTRRKPLWNQWKFLWLFVGCLSLEWIGRKLIGLV